MPAVVEPPDPLAELNETKALLATTRSNLKKSQDAGEALRAHLAELEKNPLLMVLANLDGGSVLTDAGAKLAALCTTIRRRQEKGRFTFSIAIKPFKGDALVFTPDLKLAEPKEEVAQGVFYASEDGVLSRQDPRQREFGFKTKTED